MNGLLNRRTFLGSCAAGAMAADAPRVASTEPQRQPNVVFIFPDQMRGQAMGCMGNPDVKTPRLDALAREGALLPNTIANTPVCCPARACMLTGQYSHRHGIIANDLRLREESLTLAECYHAAGYRTGFIGKWHLDGGKRMPGYVPPGPRRQGFDFWAANQCSHNHFDTQYFRDTPDPIPIETFEMNVWTDLAIEFMQDTQEQPFFLMMAPGPPHNPYGAPPEYEAMYDPEAITLRENWKPRAPNGSREAIAKYYAAITAIDDQVGRVLDELRRLNLEDNTIVVFTSDHGDMLGSHGMQMKRKPFEESIVVPGIVRYPDAVPAGQNLSSVFSHVDMAPTLLSLCGLEVPDEMHGRDFAPVLKAEAEDDIDSTLLQIFGPYHNLPVPEGWRGIRTIRYTYARTESEPWVLFDNEADPYQENNLIADENYAALRQEMDARLQQWMDDVGDSWEQNWTYPVEDKGRLYRFDTFYTVDEYLEWKKQNPDLAPQG